MDEWTLCGDKMWLYLFVCMRIVNTLFEPTFSKSIDRMEIYQGIVER